jgi:hypothetical protein
VLAAVRIRGFPAGREARAERPWRRPVSGLRRVGLPIKAGDQVGGQHGSFGPRRRPGRRAERRSNAAAGRPQR